MGSLRIGAGRCLSGTGEPSRPKCPTHPPPTPSSCQQRTDSPAAQINYLKNMTPPSVPRQSSPSWEFWGLLSMEIGEPPDQPEAVALYTLQLKKIQLHHGPLSNYQASNFFPLFLGCAAAYLASGHLQSSLHCHPSRIAVHLIISSHGRLHHSMSLTKPITQKAQPKLTSHYILRQWRKEHQCEIQ